jgi:dipeptidyl aminopeptidase/acylaminoacyl peptidase
MTRTGPFASCRVDAELIDRALGRLRRRDVRTWGGQPHWIENSGVDGAGRIVAWTDDGVSAVAVEGPPIGSSLYGYGAPAWAPVSEDRAVALTTRPLGAVSLDRRGVIHASSALDGQSAGYVCPLADDVAVVVDRGTGHGRAIVCGAPGGAWREVYTTSGLISDLVVARDGSRAAWIEWPVGSMPWDAGELRVADVDAHGPWTVTTPHVTGTCAQPTFLGADLVVDIEAEEWFHPHVVDDTGTHRVAVPEADYRPDWCLGHAWVATSGESTVWCAVRESRSRQWLERDGMVEELRGGPSYLYDVSTDESGWYALGSTPSDRGVLFHLARGATEWRVVSATEPDARWSAALELRRSPAGVPYLWYWPHVDPSFAPTDRPGLVVMVHGGPTRYASYEFSWVIELACRSGLAVASVDHRGSTSYGRTWRTALSGHWGEADVVDVVSVLTSVMDSGDVDPSRVFVRGTSAGALSALLVASETPVAGVVVVSPVSDPAALFVSEDDFECDYARTLTGGETRARSRSPQLAVATMPQRALVIHGEADPIVPIARTRSFVDALLPSRGQWAPCAPRRSGVLRLI